MTSLHFRPRTLVLGVQLHGLDTKTATQSSKKIKGHVTTTENCHVSATESYHVISDKNPAKNAI